VDLEVWLYGSLARYGGEASQRSHAELHLEMPEGTKMRDVLAHLSIPLEEKGITFVNGQLSDMPGLAADVDLELADGDRIGIFHTRSMWPLQYRFGAAANPLLQKRLKERGALHHSYK
jgi:hypothetical protein